MLINNEVDIIRHLILFLSAVKLKCCESDELGFKFILFRPQLQSDIPSVTLDVTLNGTEMKVLAILKQKPDTSRGETADKISKIIRTVQRA